MTKTASESLNDLERSGGIGTSAFMIGTDVLNLNGDSLMHLTEEDIQKWTNWYGEWLKVDEQEKTAYRILLALQ